MLEPAVAAAVALDHGRTCHSLAVVVGGTASLSAFAVHRVGRAGEEAATQGGTAQRPLRGCAPDLNSSDGEGTRRTHQGALRGMGMHPVKAAAHRRASLHAPRPRRVLLLKRKAKRR